MAHYRFPKYRAALRALREECPTLLPVRVRFLANTKGTARCAFAATNRAGDGFNVTIFGLGVSGRRLHDSELEDIAIHEWAHCLSWWPHTPGSGDHGPEWGVALSQCYRAVVGD